MALEPLDHVLTERSDAAIAVKQKPLRYVILDNVRGKLYVRNLPPGNELEMHAAVELAAELDYAVKVLTQ